METTLTPQEVNTLGYSLSQTLTFLLEDKDMLEDESYTDLVNQVKELKVKFDTYLY